MSQTGTVLAVNISSCEETTHQKPSPLRHHHSQKLQFRLKGEANEHSK